jgi:uncharacterized membrane protein YhaH (DUF805 family)
MNWYLHVLANYAVFRGRAGRPEYWYFVLFNVIASILLAILDAMIGTVIGFEEFVLLGGIYALAVLLPSIAVTVRRLHDTDRSGWWFLISLIPFVGVIVLIVFMVKQGTAGPNRFGSPPPTVPA